METGLKTAIIITAAVTAGSGWAIAQWQRQQEHQLWGINERLGMQLISMERVAKALESQNRMYRQMAGLKEE